MKIQLNSINFYDNISPQEEIIDSNESSTKLVPFGKSGIHIKKENRGSFTSYCGGKVTDACIQKGKNSPSAAIRKKATFAANARKWKHQLGGILNPIEKYIPMASNTDISDLFVDYETPPDFALKQMKQDEDNLDFNTLSYIGVNPKTETLKTAESTESNVDDIKVYEGNTETQSDSSDDTNEITLNSLASIPQNWKNALSKHLGIMGRYGYYDCSDLVKRVYKDLGITLNGNSISMYNNPNLDKFTDYTLAKFGDLVFLKGTQEKRNPNLPSHVAIVMDTSNINNGKLIVASGSPGTNTTLKEIDLNKTGYYGKHLLGFGRLKSTPIARLGMKFQFGGVPVKRISDLYTPYKSFEFKKSTPKVDYSSLFEEETLRPTITYNTPILQEAQHLEETPMTVYLEPEQRKAIPQKYSGPNYNLFKLEFDKYVLMDPDAAKFEPMLTRIAKHESNFNLSIQNTAGAPAYGWFQFWEDGKINNITRYSNLSIDLFRQNPQAQIASAVRMARSIINSFNSQDLKMAKAKGYSMNALIRGAWLGGVGGVRKVLRGTGNPNDGKWYANGKGRSVKQAMDEENQYN